MDGSTRTSTETDAEEQARLQRQFRLFQEALPKVSAAAYQMLLGAVVPTSAAVQRELEGKDGSGPAHQQLAQLAEDERERAEVSARVEQIGFQVGSKVTELLVFSNNPGLHFGQMDLLGVMKFICREVWKHLFGKQIDNLKTNHRGTFYLFDYDYQPIRDFALEGEVSERELRMVEPYLHLPGGVIRGILASLGFGGEDTVSVTVSFVELPKERVATPHQFPRGVNFNVQIAGK
ncbi:AaceriACR265Cp [[Ashbya] aceris (nom. inval.)]|nr:AaceriACR265Cp [[Ashbya] aceris (nom. inval.)]